MKIYLLSRTDQWSYDDYDALVVCAENKDAALRITPDGTPVGEGYYNGWVKSVDNIKCVEIGEANADQKEGVILTSFHAG